MATFSCTYIPIPMNLISMCRHIAMRWCGTPLCIYFSISPCKFYQYYVLFVSICQTFFWTYVLFLNNKTTESSLFEFVCGGGVGGGREGNTTILRVTWSIKKPRDNLFACQQNATTEAHTVSKHIWWHYCYHCLLLIKRRFGISYEFIPFRNWSRYDIQVLGKNAHI